MRCRGTRVQALAAGPASSEGGTPGRDAYAGFNALYAANRKPGPITEAGCTMWPIALGRRNYLFAGAADVGSGPTGAASGQFAGAIQNRGDGQSAAATCGAVYGDAENVITNVPVKTPGAA